MPALKLTLLSVTDYKRVQSADIHLDPTSSGIVALMGPNESGKTSTLDAFEALIAGRAGTKRRKPVRDGAARAVIVGEFVEPDGTTLRVTRTYVDGGSTDITVHQDGLKVARPADILARLYSHIALDPLAFANSPSDKQADTLIRLIGVDPSSFDRRHADAFATRTEANRDVKRLETELAAFPAEDQDIAGRELVQIGVLSSNIDALRDRNRQRDDLRTTIDRDEREAADLAEQIRAAQERIEVLRGQTTTHAARLTELGYVEDEQPLWEEIADADATNDAIRSQRARAAKVTELGIARDRVVNLEGMIQTVADERAAAFAEADWPVPGLEIRDGEVYLDGTPFAETSSGRKLRTSTAIAIRLNPELKAIVIRDGSLLDDDNRTLIDEIAQEHGFTVLMEIIDQNATDGVVFSDGTIIDRKGNVS